jgi:hypothetical protein
MVIKGKHKELLVELLIYYVTSNGFLRKNKRMGDDIKEQNRTGKEWIEYYINNAY